MQALMLLSVELATCDGGGLFHDILSVIGLQFRMEVIRMSC